MRYPVFLCSEQVGWVEITSLDGNYIANADCVYSCDDVLRLFGKTKDDNQIRIGVLEPDLKTGHMCIRKNLSKLLTSNSLPKSYFLDDGTGKYCINDNYKASFIPGQQHPYPFILTACVIEKTSSGYISYIKK